MKEELLDNEKSIKDGISSIRYERIFNIYKDNSYFFFNILNKVNFPEDIDPDIIGYMNLNRNLPWTTLSNQIYDTIHLWWVIFLLNKPKNIFIAEAGQQYAYILPQSLGGVLSDIQSQLNV